MSSQSTGSLHELGDVLEVGVLTLDAALVIRGWNRWLEATSGRGAADVVGRPLLEVFPELRGTQAEAAFRSALSGTTVVLSQRFHEYLLPLAPEPGFEAFARMQQSARIIPIESGDGQIDGAVALIQDVTERVAREEELRRAMQAAEDASRAKSEFLAAISHDFKTPLVAVIGYANLIEEEIAGPVTALQKGHLSRLKASAYHLISMIEEVLAFATVEAGKATVHLEELDASVLARETAEMLEPQASSRGLKLQTKIPATPVRIRADATKVRQILVNLLGNALKFTDEGVVSLELSVEPRRVCFLVHDSGPGIGAENLERIFEPFTRLERSSSPSKSGTGLGLPVSRKLARLLGGDLEVKSTPGKGSTFCLWIGHDAPNA